MPLLGRKFHKYIILFREGFNEKTSKFKEFSINILTLPSPPSLEKSFFPPQLFYMVIMFIIVKFGEKFKEEIIFYIFQMFGT